MYNRVHAKVKTFIEQLRDPFSTFVLIISIIANVIQVISSIPIEISFLFFFATFLFLIFFFKRRNVRKTQEVISKIHNNMEDHYRFLNEFLNSSKSLPAPDPIIFDEFHNISRLQNTYYVYNNNYGMKRRIKGRNLSPKPTDGIMIKIGGGSSVDYKELVIKYRKANSLQTIKPILKKEEERVKWLKLPFPRALEHGEEFSVEFEIWWPHAIRSGTDGIILGESIDYKMGINEITCTFMFDKKISIIKTYSLDIETGKFELDQSQPKEIRSKDKRYTSSYLWKKYQPPHNKFFFFIFSQN